MIGMWSWKGTTVPQLYLIWTPAQILEHVIEFTEAALKTHATLKMEFFVTLADGWRSQTNNTKNTLILDAAMVLDTSLWNNYQD